MFGIMSNKIVVSNIRFPHDEWVQLKIAAHSIGMSSNEYLRYLFQLETIRNVTGIKQVEVKAIGFAAIEAFLNRKIVRQGMGASEEDKVIYDID